MAPDAAHSILVSGPADAVAAPAHVERALAARAAVAARSPGIDQRDVVFELPDCVAAHVDGLRAQPLIAPYFASGWEPRMVDLTRLCAVQPHIHTEDAEQRVAGLEANDLRAIAAISLPKPDHSQIPVQYDAARSTWIFSARNQNLRVVRQFQGQVQPGTVGFGFVVGVVPSVFQVASFQERYLLRDGYHRAYGLLRRGITHVPAFVRAFATLQELALTPAMLPHEAFLGDRPPVLADYLDDAVTADVELPAFQKMIVIQALELTPMA
jgi:hypothetical protein